MLEEVVVAEQTKVEGEEELMKEEGEGEQMKEEVEEEQQREAEVGHYWGRVVVVLRKD